jgi:hypothetical protein
VVQVFSTKKAKFIIVILIVTLLVMIWFGCFSIDSFNLRINADKVYRIEVNGVITGMRNVVNRVEIQRIVRRSNSYLLTEGTSPGWMPGGETPNLELRFIDFNENVKWQISIFPVGHIMLTGTRTENTGLGGWHRVRGLRGWVITGAFEREILW